MTKEEIAEFNKTVGKLHVHGDRVAVIGITEDNDTGIYLPEDRKIDYILGRVIAVGDGKLAGGIVRKMYLQEGQIVFMQADKMMIAQCGCQVDGVRVLVIPQGDVLATLDATKITSETFHIAGPYVLCRVQIPEKIGAIFLPGGSTAEGSPGRPRYFVEQTGPAVDLGLEIGQEVKLVVGRASPFQLAGKLMVYAAQMDVLATVL